MLTQEEKQDILQEFPNVKLSYETITHNKVYNCNLLFAIPDGKKCFAWFTSYKNKMLCFILELDNTNKKQIKDIKIINTCFTSSLCYGTIFYGTLFYYKNTSFFSIEDISTYKGKDMSNVDISDKIGKICHILKNDIKQVAYNNYFVIFGLPVIAKSNEELDASLKSINYKLDSIKYYTSSKSNSYYSLPFEEYTNISEDRNYYIKKIDRKIDKKSYTKIFICKPDIQNDIYHLYTLDNEYIGLSAIPDYKTSVMMNNLFRIIKENNDLDALEESDDEEEFQNSNVDKFVKLDKSYKIECNFNNKFKKWVPIKIIE